jgi:hypothetical protein
VIRIVGAEEGILAVDIAAVHGVHCEVDERRCIAAIAEAV